MGLRLEQPNSKSRWAEADARHRTKGKEQIVKAVKTVWGQGAGATASWSEESRIAAVPIPEGAKSYVRRVQVAASRDKNDQFNLLRADCGAECALLQGDDAHRFELQPSPPPGGPESGRKVGMAASPRGHRT